MKLMRKVAGFSEWYEVLASASTLGTWPGLLTCEPIAGRLRKCAPRSKATQTRIDRQPDLILRGSSRIRLAKRLGESPREAPSPLCARDLTRDPCHILALHTPLLSHRQSSGGNTNCWTNCCSAQACRTAVMGSVFSEET
jgi:hypothetical protein